MTNQTSSQEGKDPILWAIARKRASFKKHLATYIVVNAFLWVLWYWGERVGEDTESIPWPAWSTLGWGLGIIFNYLDAYVNTKENAVEREYNKLTQKQR